MAAHDFDDVAALVNTWRDAMDTASPPRLRLLPPDIRASYHVARCLDDGRITDGLGERLAAEIETYLRKEAA